MKVVIIIGIVAAIILVLSLIFPKDTYSDHW